MKTNAFIAVTAGGAKLAHELQQALGGDVYVKAQYSTGAAGEISFGRLRDLIEDVFYAYKALIFFSSTGIAVRMIAPYIVHKSKDPAVVVLDERGTFAVSLLSGHLGGANELTEKIAALLHAQPVITTATDRHDLTAPDVIARELELVPYPFEHIKTINAALVEGHSIPYYIDAAWAKADSYAKALQQLGISAQLRHRDEPAAPCVFLSPERFELPGVLVLAPRVLIAGIGCRRGASEELIDKAVSQALKMAQCSDMQIKTVVSTEVKADEQGLLSWAQHRGAAVHFYGNEAMQKAIDRFHLPESAFVKRQIGIGNVCEAAVLSYNERAHIILPKTKFEKVTVSLAWE